LAVSLFFLRKSDLFTGRALFQTLLTLVVPFKYLLKKLETLLISLVYRTLKGVNDCIKGCK